MSTAFKLTLQLTERCNLQCDYCYGKHPPKPAPWSQRGPAGERSGKACLRAAPANSEASQSMSLETAVRAIEHALQHLGSARELHLHYFGGEPLLAFDTLKSIQAQAVQKCRAVQVPLTSVVITNGTLLNQEYWDFFRAENIRVILSLDGTKEGQGVHRLFPDGRNSFDEIWKFVSTLEPFEREIIQIHAVLTPDNVQFFPDSLKMLAENGFRHFSVSPDLFASWAPVSRDRFSDCLARVEKWYVECMRFQVPIFLSYIEEKIRRILEPGKFQKQICRFGRGELAIDPRGNMFPCDRMICTGATGPFCQGSISDTSGVPTLVFFDRREPSSCRTCEYRDLCTHFCGCSNYVRTGDINRPDELICFFESHYIQSAQRLAAVLLKKPALIASTGPRKGGTPC